MDKSLIGKTTIVTGASRGIGREIAWRFAQAGSDLCINYLKSEESAESLAAECREIGVKAIVVQADVREEVSARRLVQTVLDTFSVVDILVNNAGTLSRSTVDDMSVAMWDDMMLSDLRSVFLCTKFVLPSMLKRGYGRIINISSQLGQMGAAELAHYSAAKAGVIGFTKALAREVSDRGVTVNCVAPGPINGGLVLDDPDGSWERQKISELPMRRFGELTEVAGSAVFLASDPDGSIYTGQTLGPNCGDVMFS